MLDINYADYPHAKGHEDKIVEVDGRLRYKTNRVVRFMLNANGKCDLNLIWCAYDSGAFSLEEMLEFYRLIGYSLDGFEEVWEQRDPATSTKEETKDETKR